MSEGVCEIWLSSEDTGAYGRDIGTSLPEMLWQLIAVLPAHVMLRIGMTNPPYILEHLQVQLMSATTVGGLILTDSVFVVGG